MSTYERARKGVDGAGLSDYARGRKIPLSNSPLRLLRPRFAASRFTVFIGIFDLAPRLLRRAGCPGPRRGRSSTYRVFDLGKGGTIGGSLHCPATVAGTD